MPRQRTTHRTRRALREGKSASTQAGEFVRKEIAWIRKGAHGVRSTSQAIAIGRSKAQSAGVKPPPENQRSLVPRTAAEPLTSACRCMAQ